MMASQDGPIPHKRPRLNEEDVENNPEKMEIQKCARFFRTLLHLSTNNKNYARRKIKKTVMELVQEVLLKPISPEEFVTRLQNVLHSQAQPNLLPFLHKTLPSLRAAVINGEIDIPEIFESSDKDEKHGSSLSIPEIDDYWQCDKSLVQRHLCTLNHGLFADVVLSVGDEEMKLPAHKYMLMVGSPIFEKMFSDEISNGVVFETIEYEGRKLHNIKISDVPPDAMKVFLNFLYSENEIPELSGAFNTSKIDLALNLLYIAKKYLVKKLEDQCKSYLTNRINLMTIFPIFEHALLFNCDEMINACKDYLMKKECEPAFRSKAFCEISRKSLISLLELDCLGVDEFSLYGYVLTWAQSECERLMLTSTSENLREVLGSAFYLIRFPAMSLDQFADIANNKFFIDPGLLLTDAECLRIYSFLTKKNEIEDLLFKTTPRSHET
uniref:BTB/POZ domain-containing protein n=1 Tax=Acrobeloides nanus TaxID=290746 RepID=A0A914CAI4_9BILA